MTVPAPAQAPASHAITIDKLSKSFGDNEVLKDISLQIDPGEALLRTETLNAAAGTPIERGRTWWAAGRVTLTLEDHS